MLVIGKILNISGNGLLLHAGLAQEKLISETVVPASSNPYMCTENASDGILSGIPNTGEERSGPTIQASWERPSWGLECSRLFRYTRPVITSLSLYKDDCREVHLEVCYDFCPRYWADPRFVARASDWPLVCKFNPKKSLIGPLGRETHLLPT